MNISLGKNSTTLEQATSINSLSNCQKAKTTGQKKFYQSRFSTLSISCLSSKASQGLFTTVNDNISEDSSSDSEPQAPLPRLQTLQQTLEIVNDSSSDSDTSEPASPALILKKRPSQRAKLQRTHSFNKPKPLQISQKPQVQKISLFKEQPAYKIKQIKPLFKEDLKMQKEEMRQSISSISDKKTTKRVIDREELSSESESYDFEDLECKKIMLDIDQFLDAQKIEWIIPSHNNTNGCRIRTDKALWINFSKRGAPSSLMQRRKFKTLKINSVIETKQTLN